MHRIAIDGPAGAGKSTVARLVAEHLNYLYIDTGAMYRAITLKAMRTNISLNDQASLTELATNTDVKLINDGNITRVFCDNLEVTEEIRSPGVNQNVSLVSTVPGVRNRMVELQREMAKTGNVVMDGRDISTYVLPNADFKFFLTASQNERAIRRCNELKARGYIVDLEKVTKDLIERDLMDTQREMAPLIQAPDAIMIDTSGLTIDQVVERILTICRGSSDDL